MNKIVCFFFVFTALGSQALFAQDVRGKVIMDTSEILIGDQTRMILELNKPENTMVEWPTLGDSINEHVQVASRSTMDTLIKGNMQTIRQSYMLTSFDSGLYYIKPFYFLTKQNGEIDTIYTSSLALNVLTIPIDTTKPYFGIKPLMEVSRTFRDFLPWILSCLGILFIVALTIYFWRKWRNIQNPEFTQKQKPKEPAHIVALRELKKIEEEKIWRDDLNKEYYTQITDALRFYIGERFEIDAKEMTSIEIIKALKTKEIDKSLFTKLQNLLSTSDLVKFAKVRPSGEENEGHLAHAKNFIESTKIEAKTLIESLNESEIKKSEE